MCYSAQIWQDYRKYARQYGADLAIEEFVALYWHRQQGARVGTAKAMDAAFASADPDPQGRISRAIGAAAGAQAAALQQQLFAQRRRLAEAERSLQARTTVKASESRRIATANLQRIGQRLADLGRERLVEADARIYPGQFAPVVVHRDGRRVLRPMRYQCRPAGKPASHDRRYPGTYNARRDSLQGYWKDLFGYSHGVVAMHAFYEHVSVPDPEATSAGAAAPATRNVVLEFRPEDGSVMLVACLWSHWRGQYGEELLSFAAITDEPPPEVAAAGHDRCIIPIRPANLDAWLQPDPGDLAAQQAILEDRERPCYRHRVAA